MYEIDIDNTIAQQPFAGLMVEQLVRNPQMEILSVSLSQGAVVPRHSSPRNVHLVVLEGEIDFFIKNQVVTLGVQQHFSFSKETDHWVRARENSKFLIIR